MIITILPRRSTGTKTNQIKDMNELETDASIQKIIINNNEDVSVHEKTPSMNEVNVLEKNTDFNKETQESLLIKKIDSCHHCEEFKGLSFAVCPNCGNPLKISESPEE